MAKRPRTSRIDRRSFLKASALAAPALAAAPLHAAPGEYRVGVGRNANGYIAAMRAINASGEWPGPAVIAGRKVIIKPNLVSGTAPETGAVTDPEVTRAVVDRALADGAQSVAIIETSPVGAHFDACGYGFFASYDALNRVSLIDSNSVPLVAAPVRWPLAYSSILVPGLVMDPEAVFISVAKLKTHAEAFATLSMKNLFGLPAVNGYISTPARGRFGMHDRGVSLTIIDLNRMRPCDFAVVDGIWGMEGNGPLAGTPVQMNTVLAGRNALAVDRVGLAAMQMPEGAVQHINYAARFGLGPASLSDITVAGDPLTTRPFLIPPTSPVIEYPRVFPRTFIPGAGQSTRVTCWYAESCVRSIEIVRLHTDITGMDVLRTLQPVAQRAAGFEVTHWDGRLDSGDIAPPGVYAVHVRAYSVRARVRHADSVAWVIVSD